MLRREFVGAEQVASQRWLPDLCPEVLLVVLSHACACLRRCRVAPVEPWVGARNPLSRDCSPASSLRYPAAAAHLRVSCEGLWAGDMEGARCDGNLDLRPVLRVHDDFK